MNTARLTYYCRAGALAALLSGCGQDPEGTGSTKFDAPRIGDATAHGFAFIGIDESGVDRPTAIYFYDFEGGEIRRIGPGPSKDARLLWLNNQLWVFGRARGDLHAMPVMIGGVGGQAHDSLGDPQQPSWLHVGDPVHGTSLSDDTWVLAMGHKGQVVTLAPTEAQPTLEDLATVVEIDWGSDITSPAPVWIQSHKEDTLVLHQGVTSSGASDGTQAVARLAGLPDRHETTQVLNLTAPLPSRLHHVKADNAWVLGLCPQTQGSCTPKIEKVALSPTLASSLVAELSQSLYLKGSSVDGPADTIWVHGSTSTGSGIYEVSLPTSASLRGAVRTIHAYAAKADGLYALEVDSGASVGLIGDRSQATNGAGVLRIFDATSGAAAETEAVELPDVPVTGVLVP